MNLNDFYEKRNDYFLKLSSTARGGLILFMLLGVIAFAAGMLTGDYTRTWGALLLNVLFFYSLALGGVAFGVMQDIVGATWGRPIKRLHESFGTFLVPSTIMLIAFLLAVKFRLWGAGDVYSWVKDPHMLDHFGGKAIWLQENIMIVRNIGVLLLILFTAKWQLKQTIDRDMILLAGNKDKAMEVGLQAKQRLRFFAAPCLIVYGYGLTFLFFDLTMSLEPLWFSTLWGGWFFSIMMHTLMAAILVFMFAFKGTAFGQFFKQQQFHDVGKMMHGFTAFFGYLTYAHILTYWYGNVPEETEYFIHRLHAPWIYFVCAIFILAFTIPMFVLVPKAAKWTKAVALPMSLVILAAQWMTYLVVIMPATADGATWKFPTIELGLFLGCLGLFVGGIYHFGKRVPMLSIADPLLPEALNDAH